MDELENLILDNMTVVFNCRAAEEYLVVATKSIILAPVSEEDIGRIQARLGRFSAEFVDFYKKYGGISFHEQAESGVASLCVHPIDNWALLYAEMSDWFDDELVGGSIDWLDSCVVFAEVPRSGNYFLIPLAGVDQGKIIYQDHDGLESEVYANSFAEFLCKFLRSPVEQMDRLGCHTRYSDNQTDKQWMPVAIV